MRSAELSKKVEVFWEKVSMEIKNLKVNEEYNSNIEEIYNKKIDWWNKEFIKELIKQAKETRDIETRNITNFLLGEYKNIILYDIEEEFNFKKQKFYADYYPLINGKPCEEKNEQIKNVLIKHSTILEDIKNYYLKRSKILEEELGYPCFNKLWVELHGIDITKYKNTCIDILNVTGKIFKDLQESVLKYNNTTSKGSIYDILYMQANLLYELKDIKVDNIFSKLNVKNEDINIHYDKRFERPSCLAIKVPEEIHLFMNRRNGVEFLQILMHELGHGVHYLSLDKELSVGQKQLGFRGITETFAYFTQLMLIDKNFLKYLNIVSEDCLDPLLIYYKWDFLRQMRFVCTKVLISLKHMERNSYESFMNYTTNLLRDTFFVDFPEEIYWLYISDISNSIEYFFAWINAIKLNSNTNAIDLFNKCENLSKIHENSDLPLLFGNEHNYLHNINFQGNLGKVFEFI